MADFTVVNRITRITQSTLAQQVLHSNIVQPGRYKQDIKL